MFWSLFVIGILQDGSIDYTNYGIVSSFETRYECELAKEYLIEQLGPPPEDIDVICLRTDKT